MNVDEIKKQYVLEHFGKNIEEMNKEELLMAISAVANKLHGKTGNKRYKDVEDSALNILDVLGKTGGDDNAAVESTVKMLKKRGYKEGGELK